MEKLIDYLRRYCTKDEIYDYFMKEGTMNKLGVSEYEKDSDDYRYYSSEYKSLCREFSSMIDDKTSATITLCSLLMELQFLYNRRFGFDIMSPFLEYIDKYRAEKGFDWRKVDDYMRLWVDGSLLGFEVDFNHSDPSDKNSSMIINMTKEGYCNIGYKITIDTEFSYDEIKKSKNWIKAISKIIEEYKKYQEIVKNIDIIVEK